MKHLKKLLPLTSLGYLLTAATVFAADDGGTLTITQPSQVTFTNLGSLVGGAVGLVIIFALIIAFFFLLIGGIKWITSGGDKAQVEEARNQITNALIGLSVVAAAWAIMKLIGFFFGINPFALDIPTVADK